MIGPCVRDLCTADAVAYVARTTGSSARLTVITGDRAEALADMPHGSALDVVCAEHAAQELDALLRGGQA